MSDSIEIHRDLGLMRWEIVLPEIDKMICLSDEDFIRIFRPAFERLGLIAKDKYEKYMKAGKPIPGAEYSCERCSAAHGFTIIVDLPGERREGLFIPENLVETMYKTLKGKLDE